MIEKKYQFFIDTLSQNDFLNKKVSAKKPNSEGIQLIKHLPNFERLMACIEEYKTNTKNDFFKNFCIDNKISSEIYFQTLRLFPEIVITYFDLQELDKLPSDASIVKDENTRLTFEYINSLTSSKLPYIIKIKHNEYFNWDKNVNHGKDIILSKELVQKTNTANLKYRLYINDRLLIERFFPKDLPTSKTICEECYLELKQPVKVRLETDYNLIFTKAVSNNNAVYPNSKEFILEP